jgi:5-methylthioadenosine/S-adenosylhomocysteine deaminase
MKNTIFITALAVSLVACSPQPDPPPAEDRIDLIIEGDHVVTMDGGETVIENGAVAVNDGVILGVGAAVDIHANYSAVETLSGTNRVVLPGLVNGHSHAAMTLLRGGGDDIALVDWLNNFIFPSEVEFVDADFVRIGTELACWEMIRGGTTTFVDMYYYPDVIADVVDQCVYRSMARQEQPHYTDLRTARQLHLECRTVAGDQGCCDAIRVANQHSHVRITF